MKVGLMDIPGILSQAERHDQMQQAINLHLPFLKKAKFFHGGVMSIVGYGPSLADTWKEIRNPDMAVSGAYNFLADRGRIPHYYTAMDPRKSVAGLLRKPIHNGTQFLMASVCHPDFWDILKGFHVELWHLINEPEDVEWVEHHHPAGIHSMIGGGSTIGHRAMNVASALGYRRFRLFGIDCSFTDKRHAGEHNGEIEPVIEVTANDRVFKTTPQLWKSARELCQLILTADIEVEVFGDGMFQEMARLLLKGKR